MKHFILAILKFKLGILARLTIWRYQPGIVGITGSVGKTSIKTAIAAVLGRDRKIRASIKSFNNEIGLPLTILGEWDSIEGFFFWPRVIIFSLFQLIVKNPSYPSIIVLEYGIDRPGDMKRLLKIARPQIGVIGALGEIPVHVEFFAGPEAVRNEKSKLVGALPTTGFVILNSDDANVLAMKEQSRAHPVTYGFSNGADVKITNFMSRLEKNFCGVSFKLRYGGSVVPARINGAFGAPQAYAAAAGAAVGLIYGMNLVKIAEALHAYEPPAGRLRFLAGIKESSIIDDTYNASPTAVAEALDTLHSLPAKRKIVVLGDMLELGKYTMTAHENVGRLAAKSADIIFTVGTRAKFIAESALKARFPKNKIFSFLDIHEAGLALQSKIQKGDLILVKGSQSVRMEKIVKEVMAEPIKAHELLVRQTKVWLRRRGLYG